MAVAEQDLSVMLGPRSLGVTLRLAADVTLYADMPLPVGAGQMNEKELEREARAQAARLFRAAAADLI